MDITYDPFLIIILAIAILIVMVITLSFFLKGKPFDKYYVATVLFGVYFVFLIKFIIFPFTIFNNLLDAGNYVITDYINIIPFNQLMGASTADWLQVFGNLVLLLPLGIYISVMKPGIALGRMVCIGLLISILIESVQLFLDIIFIYPNHFMDITDIIFNVSGFILGYLISRTALVKNIYPIDKLD